MTYFVEITAQVEQDLRGIYEYIAYELRSEQNAAAQLDRFEESVSALGQMPERYRVLYAGSSPQDCEYPSYSLRGQGHGGCPCRDNTITTYKGTPQSFSAVCPFCLCFPAFSFLSKMMIIFISI